MPRTAPTPTPGASDDALEPELAPPDAHDDAHDAAADGDDAATSALLALLDPTPAVVVPETIHGVVIGTLLGLEGGVRVAWPGAPGGVGARALAVLEPRHVGGEVALMFEAGDPARPLVMAPVAHLEPAPCDPSVDEPPASAPPSGGTDAAMTLEAVVDGERVVLEAERELVLRCGKASITLTRAGKIILRGAYVSSHATGTNRIRGGTVEIN